MGAAASDARNVIARALEKGRRFTCQLVTQVAPDVVGVEIASDLVRARLLNGNNRPWPLRGIFKGLQLGVASWKQTLYDETIHALTHSNSYVADAAADALESMNHPCDSKHVAALHDAWKFWLEHKGWCDRCEIDVGGRFCSKCHVGIHTPLGSLVRQLVRCGGLTPVELRSLASNDDPVVTKAAKQALNA